MHVEKIKSNLFKRVLQISGYWSRGPRALKKKWLQSHSQLKCKTAPKQTGRWSVWSSQSSRPWGCRPFWGRSLIISVVNRYWGVAEFAIPKHASWGIDYFKLVICKKQKTEKETLTLPFTCLKERSYYLIVETKCGRQGESKQSVCLLDSLHCSGCSSQNLFCTCLLFSSACELAPLSFETPYSYPP